jgi:hypothetical protein
MVARRFQVDQHLPDLLVLAPANFLLLPRIKKQNPHPGDCQQGVGGGSQNPLGDDFTMAFTGGGMSAAKRA